MDAYRYGVHDREELEQLAAQCSNDLCDELSRPAVPIKPSRRNAGRTDKQ